MAQTHYFPKDRVHFTWDMENEPVMTVASGDTVVMHTRDTSDNQVNPDSTVEIIDNLDWDRVYPLAGPIRVEGAQPGDTLAVEILDLHTQGWGWTAIIPGFGLLPDEFTQPYLKLFDLAGGDVTFLREDITIPIEPFLGVMGVGPDLFVAAQDSIRAMIAHLSQNYCLSREDAYILSSLVVDLRISEIVDAGHYIVSSLLPLAVFRS